MTITRADTLTISKKQREYFSDFLNSFAYSPVNNNLAKITNEQSVKQSLKNLVLTNLGERLFQPNIGCGINNLLFENSTKQTLSSIEFNVQNTIKFNEPRVVVINVEAKETNNPNEVTITIVFSMINNPEPISINFILKRVR